MGRIIVEYVVLYVRNDACVVYNGKSCITVSNSIIVDIHREICDIANPHTVSASGTIYNVVISITAFRRWISIVPVIESVPCPIRDMSFTLITTFGVMTNLPAGRTIISL